MKNKKLIAATAGGALALLLLGTAVVYGIRSDMDKKAAEATVQVTELVTTELVLTDRISAGELAAAEGVKEGSSVKVTDKETGEEREYKVAVDEEGNRLIVDEQGARIELGAGEEIVVEKTVTTEMVVMTTVPATEIKGDKQQAAAGTIKTAAATENQAASQKPAGTASKPTTKPTATTENQTASQKPATKPTATTENQAASQKPAGTTSKPTTKPSATTSKPTATTEKATTESQTASQKPAGTTSKPTTKPSATTSKPAATTEAATTEHIKVWHEPEYEYVWVVEEEAFDYTYPVYKEKEICVCNKCGADVTEDIDNHTYTHTRYYDALGDYSHDSWHTDYIEIQVGTKTDHFDEVGYWDRVLVKEGYWE